MEGRSQRLHFNHVAEVNKVELLCESCKMKIGSKVVRDVYRY